MLTGPNTAMEIFIKWMLLDTSPFEVYHFNQRTSDVYKIKQITQVTDLYDLSKEVIIVFGTKDETIEGVRRRAKALRF
jgi:hypothetical protein